MYSVDTEGGTVAVMRTRRVGSARTPATVGKFDAVVLDGHRNASTTALMLAAVLPCVLCVRWE